MPHHFDLILTLTGGLTAALILGFLAQKLRLSPIVGYLLAGVVVGPFTPGFVANSEISGQFAELGVVLLMFGVGLHFHLKDLLAVKTLAIPGALLQMAAATALGGGVMRLFGWSWPAAIVFGISISVASTVVLTRVLADHRALHTRVGHIAIGWLIVQDLFTIFVLVVLPAVFGAHESGGALWVTLGLAILKLAVLVVFTLVAGQRLIPLCLGYVARTGSRDLFTLTILVLALGIAVGSAKFFGASMALGAFLAGMVVGQSEFSARAASDALPMRDAFAVLFFVSVGMMFDPKTLSTGWPLMLATTGIVVFGKSLAALAVVLLFKQPLGLALGVSVAQAQIGEFSFILASLAQGLKILPQEATNALVAASVISITLNSLLFQGVGPLVEWLERRGWSRKAPLPAPGEPPVRGKGLPRVLVIGYGPIGRTLSRILRENSVQVVVVEMNLDTVQQLREADEEVVYGDAGQREILHHAGVEKALGLIIAASSVEARPVVEAARALNPKIRILTRASYLAEAEALQASGANAIFSSEGEIALSMTAFLMRTLGASDEQIDRERARVRAEIFEPVGAQTASPRGAFWSGRNR